MALNFILSALSFIIPKDTNLIILGSYNTFAGNTKAFYLYLINRQRENFKIYWITHNKTIYRLLKNRQLPVLYIYTLRAFIHILRGNYLLLTHGPIDVSYFYFLFGRFNMIQTWHGIALKDITPTAEQKAPLHMRVINYFSRLNDKSYKLILASSNETHRIFIAAFNNENVRIVGYPRNDILYDKELLFEDYKKKLKLCNFQKIILYAPTFRENSTLKPFSKDFIRMLNEYLVDMNYVLLIKKHPYDNFLLNGLNLNEYSNIIDVSNIVIDIQDLLVDIDILITDYSSIMFDFVLLNRPIIFYPYDIHLYTDRCRGLYYDYFEDLPGPFAMTEQELLTLLKNIYILFEDNNYQRKYREFKERFHYYQDGNSCKRLFDTLVNLS